MEPKDDQYQLSVYLDRKTAARFRAKAFEDGKRMAEIIRELIEAYLSGRIKI